MGTAGKNRRVTARDKVRKDIMEYIAWLEKRIKDVDAGLIKNIKESSAWREKDEMMQCMRGVGPVMSVASLAGLAESGTLGRRDVGALVRVAPFNCDSGKHNGKRRIWGG